MEVNTIIIFYLNATSTGPKKNKYDEYKNEVYP